MTATTLRPAHPLTVFVDGIGLLGPGLSSWAQARQVLETGLDYTPATSILPSPVALPPAERRRAGAVVKVSLAVGQEAVAASGLQASALATVFSSSGGDGINCHEICRALASGDRLISPTRFHNSVHNAASGYWGICTGAMATSSVLCAHDGSFSAGLLEAMTQVAVEQTSVLLLAYDTNYPEPLHSVRPIQDTFGVALVLSAQRSERSLAQWSLAASSCLSQASAEQLEHPELELLRQHIPAARCLPLLRSLALQRSGQVVLDYLQGAQLAVQQEPCP
jgi:hypothetical protein